MPQYYYFAGEGMPYYESSYRSGRSIMPPSRFARASLGNADWLESTAPNSLSYPPTRTHRVITEGNWAAGDWPPVRTSGPEPLSPGEMALWQKHPMSLHGLSDMEKNALGIALVIGIGYLAFR